MAGRIAGQAPAKPADCRSEYGALLGPVERTRIVTPIPELVLQNRTPQAPVGHILDRFAVGLEPDVEDPATGLFRRRLRTSAMHGQIGKWACRVRVGKDRSNEWWARVVKKH